MTRVAYLTSQYPATSHTFISREVAAVRATGMTVDTFSIRPPSAAELADREIAAEAATTFTVLKQPGAEFLAAHISTLLGNPPGYLRALRLAVRHRPPGVRGLGLSIVHFAEAVLLARELRRRGVTRLHNHFANSAATVGYLATRLLKMPWSFTMHGISETDYPAGLMLGQKIEGAEFVACVSYFGRAQAMRAVAPEHWGKLHIVRCGLPMEKLPQFKKGGGGKSLICVGRLSPEKGQAGLLEAFAALARHDRGLDLVLIGDGPQSAQLQAIAAKLGVDKRVRFAGRLGEADTLTEIAKADVLVVSSFMEGLPIVLMEAMALGTAVIASRVAGIPELVKEGESGLLFTPSNWSELAECMARLIGDDGLRRRLTKSARAAVAEFDVLRSAEGLGQLFESN